MQTSPKKMTVQAAELTQQEQNILSLLSHNNESMVYEEEIPLAIQIMSTSSEISSFGSEYFNDTDKFKDYDKVIAVTVTFSEENLK